MTQTKSDEAHFRLRIPREIHDFLKDEARRNYRSVNSEILRALAEYQALAERERRRQDREATA